MLAVRFHVFPASGRGGWLHLVMPATALALWLTALLARVTRSEMIEALEQDYVRTARAKGLAERGDRRPPRAEERAPADHHRAWGSSSAGSWAARS